MAYKEIGTFIDPMAIINIINPHMVIDITTRGRGINRDIIIDIIKTGDPVGRSFRFPIHM